MFMEVLARLEDLLEVPYPERHELLRELRTHLEDLYEDHLASGYPPGDAYQLTLEAMALDIDFVASISEVHRPLVARALARLPRNVSLGLEYGAIGATGLLLLTSVLLRGAPMLEALLEGGMFMIPLILAALAIVFIGLEGLYSLFVKKDHSVKNLGRRFISLRFLAIATTLTGLIGTLMGFYLAFTAAETVDPFPVFLAAKIAITPTIVGMTLSLLALVFYFLIEAKVARIREMRLTAS
jgi:hypothetical protein